MCYADLFLSEEAHAACVPAGSSKCFGRQAAAYSGHHSGTAEGGDSSALSLDATTAAAPAANMAAPMGPNQTAFASHAWGTPFSEFRHGLLSWPRTDFWIGKETDGMD